MTTGDAARRLDLSPAAVRKMASRGEIPVAQKLDGRLGAYLFRRTDVEALAARRREELEQKLARMQGAAS